jgi:outer membrane protein assembly factor BamD (BamD/ComL family)
METYKQLIKLYPNSIFAEVSKKRIHEVELLIDADHVNIIQFYEKMGNTKASEVRMQKLENSKP